MCLIVCHNTLKPFISAGITHGRVSFDRIHMHPFQTL